MLEFVNTANTNLTINLSEWAVSVFVRNGSGCHVFADGMPADASRGVGSGGCGDIWVFSPIGGMDDFYVENPLPDECSFYNPILPGWNSDPSICTNGEGDYFIATSSFTLCAGWCLCYHSRDLVNWRQVGHVLTRESQMNNFRHQHVSGGIFAPDHQV